MKLKLAFLLLLCSFLRARAQPLQPGDTLPISTIDGINAAEYGDKLLILDFWASSCSSCIEAMPKMAALQKQYRERIKIILVGYEKPERIRNFLNARPDLASLNLPVIAHDTTFSKMFVHQYLPHVVWIYKRTYIKATGAENVNPKSIDSVLKGEKLTVEQKTDIIGFNYSQPLFPVTANRQTGISPLYSSSFSGYIDGLPLSAGTVTDSVSHRKRYYIINHSIVHLYAIALNSGLPLQANRRALPNEHEYDYRATDGYRSKWEQRHTYCYEFTGPKDTPDSLIKSKLHSDLDAYLGLRGRIENRKVRCLLLTGNPKPSRQGRLIRQDTSGQYTHLRHISAADLVYILNQQTAMPPVLDQTGTAVSFDLPVINPPVTIAGWRHLLGSNGLRLVPATKVLPMFILTTN